MDNSDSKNQQRYIFSILSKIKASGGDGTTPDFSQARIEFVESLPTASANTLGVIYVIPNQDGMSGSIHLTKYDGQSYSWVAAGEKGEAGATPNISIGTVTSGEQASATIGGTPANPVLNLVLPQGPQGPQGNTGSSVDYPYELVNNRTTDDATKGLSAAEGKRLGDDISQLRQEVAGNLMSARAKNALLAVFDKVAFAVPDVSAEMSELNKALFNLDEIVGIIATYTQGSKVIWSDGVSVLNDLKTDLIVKAIYGDGTEVAVTNYTISGTLTSGTSVITVEYEGLTTTFNVTVTEYGSKMSYTMAEGTIMNKHGRVTEYTYDGEQYCQGLNNYELESDMTRRVFPVNFGKTKMRNYSTLNFVDAYPIKIPRNATSVSATISGSNQQIALRVLYLLPNGHYIWRGTDSATYPGKTAVYATGSNTMDLSNVAGRTDTYLFAWGQRVNGASYSGNEPTAITITFNE